MDNPSLFVISTISTHVTQKQDLIFVIAVMPKQALAGTSPAKPSYGMTLTIKHDL